MKNFKNNQKHKKHINNQAFLQAINLKNQKIYNTIKTIKIK